MLEKFLVGVGDVVIGDGDHLDLRRQAFEGCEIGVPWVHRSAPNWLLRMVPGAWICGSHRCHSEPRLIIFPPTTSGFRVAVLDQKATGATISKYTILASVTAHSKTAYGAKRVSPTRALPRLRAIAAATLGRSECPLSHFDCPEPHFRYRPNFGNWRSASECLRLPTTGQKAAKSRKWKEEELRLLFFEVSAIAMAKRDGFPWNPIRRAEPIRLRFTLARDPQRGNSKLRAWTSVWLIRSPRRWRDDDEVGVARAGSSNDRVLAIGAASVRSLAPGADHEED